VQREKSQAESLAEEAALSSDWQKERGRVLARARACYETILK